MKARQPPVRISAAVAAAIFFWSSTALAYSAMPERGHAVLSNLAIDLFNLCVERGYGKPEYLLDQHERRTIVEANLDEDRTRLLRRGLNWHFYNPQMESKQRILLVINRSFIPLFNEIDARLKQPELPWIGALRAIGRAIHFMEDLTVPAHSVPVFHGPGLSDAYENFPLSGAPSASDLLPRIGADLNPVCSRLSSLRPYGSSENGTPGGPMKNGSLSLREILDRTRSITLARLDDRICDPPEHFEVTWQYFWVPPQANRYFGTYRQGAEFGAVSEIKDNGLSCEITPAKYRQFSARLHLEAVFADVRALYWFSARHQRPSPTIRRQSESDGPV